MKTNNKCIILIILLIIIDQLFKYFMPFKVKNYGASFNLLENQVFLLVLSSIMALMFFVYLFIKNKENKFGISLLIAGTTSNIIDRILLGYIIDYIPLPYLFTFNLADLVNFVGVIILIRDVWKK